jgi:hypothetical protein
LRDAVQARAQLRRATRAAERRLSELEEARAPRPEIEAAERALELAREEFRRVVRESPQE